MDSTFELDYGHSGEASVSKVSSSRFVDSSFELDYGHSGEASVSNELRRDSRLIRPPMHYNDSNPKVEQKVNRHQHKAPLLISDEDLQ